MKMTLTVAEVADLLAISTASVYTLVREDRIPYVRVGRLIRFHREKVDAWLRGANVDM